MKKTLSVLIIVLFATVLIVSCDNEKTYNIGDTGPAGGIIFYDVDADNDEDGGAGEDGLKSSECGWRYLEGALTNVTIGSENTFCFGYYREEASSENKKIVEGNEGALAVVGKGKSNTDALVKAFGNSAYSEASGNTTTSNYAAYVASSYTSGGYSDWFLPSACEIVKMMDVEGLNVTTSTVLWSSSERNGTNANAAPFEKTSGSYTDKAKSEKYAVRPVRRF